MVYSNIKKAKFLDRPNRFIANIEIDGVQEICHVKNTGRCRELFIPGADVYVQEAGGEKRKTKYDLISVVKGNRLINVDSQIPNRVFYEWMQTGAFQPDITAIRPECRFLNSRFDFYVEYADKKAFVEVKGVTLEKEGTAMFPDAPTERGVKHVTELIECKKMGYDAYVVFVIQMKGVQYFTPNDETHKAFGDILREAEKKGVSVCAIDCEVFHNAITPGHPVDIILR